MPLDPEIAAVLDLMHAQGINGIGDVTPEQARANFRFLTVDLRDAAQLRQVKEVQDLTIDGPGGALPVRVYRPEADGPVPTIVFFHGGGWVIGDLDTHDDHARLLCHDVSAVVVSVDYRLAPEHPFPAAFDDCFAATRWAAEHVDELGGDAGRIAVAGDSAGGNLAAAVAIAARDAGIALAAQLLIYPGTYMTEDDEHPSRVTNADGLFLTDDDMRWFRDLYLPDAASQTDPRAAVLAAPDVSGVAPAVVTAGEFDPLHDEGVAYAHKLRDAGVDVVLLDEPGLVHGYFGMGPMSAGARAGVDRAVEALRDLLA